METFKPTKASLEFWEYYFQKFSEVTLIDYLNALIPLLENETNRKFTDNQLLVLIDILNYENQFKINKYESQFFIDRIWNSKEIQGKIWNDKYVPVKSKVDKFVKERELKKAEALAASMFSSISNITMMQKPVKLKDQLDPLEQKKVESHRNLMYLMTCIQGNSM